MRRQTGFTYLGVMFVVVLMGLGLAGAGQFWSINSQRDREAELLWVGSQYARALRAYYERSPGRKTFPLELDELLLDLRFPTPVRHLRQRYADPMARDTEWGLIRNSSGRIAGIYSQAIGTPLKQANFPSAWEEFAGLQSYAGWRFIADPALRPQRTVTGAGAATGMAAAGR